MPSDERQPAEDGSGGGVLVPVEKVLLELLEEAVEPGVQLQAEADGRDDVGREADDDSDQDGSLHTSLMMPELQACSYSGEAH